jgi:malonyl-CoA O-methyltransferase
MDPLAARRWAALKSFAEVKGAAQSPWLHEEVARRMEERLQWITLQPKAWMHWGPMRGGLNIHQALARRYPQAGCAVFESDASHARLVQTELQPPWWQPARWLTRPTGFEMPESGSMDMLWANMALHMSEEPQSLIERWQKLLAVDGFLMFSCLGPDTLRELRLIFADMHWPAPAHEFTDMHDWGDMLIQAGFSEPVMDMERITLSFETPQRLLQELRTLGRNLSPSRFSALRGRRWREQLHEVLQARLKGADGRLFLTFEVIYGHALKAAPRLSMQPQTTLSLDQMRQSLTRNRRR